MSLLVSAVVCVCWSMRWPRSWRDWCQWMPRFHPRYTNRKIHSSTGALDTVDLPCLLSSFSDASLTTLWLNTTGRSIPPLLFRDKPTLGSCQSQTLDIITVLVSLSPWQCDVSKRELDTSDVIPMPSAHWALRHCLESRRSRGKQ